MPISESNLFPNEVIVEYEGGVHAFAHPSSRMTYKDIVVDLVPNRADEPARLEIGIAADKSALLALTIRWEHSWRPSMRFLGNVWGDSVELLRDGIFCCIRAGITHYYDMDGNERHFRSF